MTELIQLKFKRKLLEMNIKSIGKKIEDYKNELAKLENEPNSIKRTTKIEKKRSKLQEAYKKLDELSREDKVLYERVIQLENPEQYKRNMQLKYKNLTYSTNSTSNNALESFLARSNQSSIDDISYFSIEPTVYIVRYGNEIYHVTVKAI